MTHISWEYLAAQKGEQFEDIIAVLLRQKFSNIQQIGLGKGDKGVDLVQEHADGVTIWQIKRFVTAPNNSQFGQIQKSWDRFWRDYLSPNPEAVIGYRLITPWVPNSNRQADFKKMTKDASFPCRWDGGDYLDGLHAEFPHVIDAALKGPGYLEHMVTAKATLASAPIEKTDVVTMLEAYNTRVTKLREIGDMLVPGHVIDQGTITFPQGFNDDLFLTLSKNRSGVIHSYLAVDDTRLEYKSIVPDPKSWRPENAIRVSIDVPSNLSADQKTQLEDWYKWGKPFKNINLRVRPVNAEGQVIEDFGVGVANFYLQDEIPQKIMDAFSLTVQKKNGKNHVIPLVLDERTTGINGSAARILLKTRESMLEFELFFENVKFNSIQEGKVRMVYDGNHRRPENICLEMSILGNLKPHDLIQINFQGEPFARAEGFLPVSQIEKIHNLAMVAKALVTINKKNLMNIPFPDPNQLSAIQINRILELGEVYSNKGFQGTWETGSIDFRIAPSQLKLPEGGALVAYYYPELKIGKQTFELARCIREVVSGADFTDLQRKATKPGTHLIKAHKNKGQVSKHYLRIKEARELKIPWQRPDTH